MPRIKHEEATIIEEEVSGIGLDTPVEPTVEEDQEKKLDQKDAQIAFLTEEMRRMNAVVSQLAKKQSIPTGEIKKEFLDGEAEILYTIDGKRFAEWQATGAYEDTIGDSTQKHFIYKLTYELPDGKLETEENVPQRTFKNKLASAVRVPVSMPNYLKRVREGDHYVNRSVSSIAGHPIKPEEDIEVVIGRRMPDGVTKMYDGEKKKIKFYTLNAS